jgi:hypothetical protein
MNQALILSLMPMLQHFATQQQPPAPATRAKEGDAKAPTSFSGEDHAKLRDFLFECGLIFDMKPYTYATEKSRVLYAIQHLDGMAKRHFRRYIESGSTSPIVNRWAEFVNELTSIFGDPDRMGKAADKILALRMKENSRVHRYTVLFREAADELGWPDNVLHRLYYTGLANRIKDLWARTDPPADFERLVREAQHADNRYWKRVEEKRAESTPARSNDAKSSHKPPTSSSSNPNSSQTNTSQPRTQSTTQNPSTSSRSTSTPSKDKSKDLSNILGPDGKLLPEERARRERLGLCFYCAEKHATDQCPKKASKPKDNKTPSGASSSPAKPAANASSSSKPKGRTAQAAVADESKTEDSADTTDF